MHSVTDRRTDRQTNDRITPIADHAVFILYDRQYDRLMILDDYERPKRTLAEMMRFMEPTGKF